MSRITAQEARELVGPTPQEVVDEVYPKIRQAALDKKLELKLRHEPWARGGYARTNEWRDAVAILEHDGFKVEFFYEERQFVDMGTKISW